MANDSLELIPLHFLYPGVFWALESRTSGGHMLSLQQDLTERITAYALSPEAWLLEQFQTNGHCIAMLDSIWARGQCRRRLRRKFDYLVEVFFIDYGVTRTIGMEEILEMPDLFKELKPRAKRYGLYGARVTEKFESSSLLHEQWGRSVDELLGISHSDLASRPVVKAEVRGYVGSVAFVSCILTDSGGLEESIVSKLISSGLAEEYTGLPSLLENSETESLSTQEARSMLSKSTAVSTVSQVSAFRVYHSAYHPQAFLQGEDVPPMVLSPSQCFSDGFINQLTTLSFPGPTLAQSHAWPIILSGRDLLCISPPQSGKTLAYLLPLLHRFLVSTDSYEHLRSLTGPVILILCGSTREADYVYMVCRNVISWKDPSKVNLCAVAYQGFEASAIDCLSSGADILVCTPCSALRLLTTHVFSLARLCHLVFDNSDSLAVNYEPELKLFMRKYAAFLQEDTSVKNRVRPQILIFSAAYSPAILSLMRAYTINRVTLITCPIETSVFQALPQQLVNCRTNDKLDKLVGCLQANAHRAAICLSNLSTLPDLSRVLANNEWGFHVLSQNVESSKEAMNLLNEWESKQEERNGKPDVLILFDDAIERFSINLSYLQVSTLIHFEFPNAGSTKKVFRSRFRLLTESFNRGLVSSCESLIFLTKELGNKISYLFHFHTRLGYSIPAEVSTQLAKIRETVKFSKQGDLCYYFKSFGECPHSSCSFLHRIPVADSPTRSVSSFHSSLEQTELISFPETPQSGSVRILISHVSSPSQIWVRILEHYPERLGDVICPSFSASQALTLNREIQSFSSVWHTKDHVCVPRLGQYYALYDAGDNLFYRVQTLKFSRPLDQLIFFHLEKVEVRCIDTGELKVVYANQLLPLPNHLYQVPRQVVEAVCCLIKPVDKDLDWSPQSCDSAARCLQGKTFTGRIAYNFSGILFFDLLENVYSLQSLQMTGCSVSYPQHFINKGFAISNPSHLLQLGIPPYTNSGATHIAYASLQLQSDVAVYISAIETPNLFYAQNSTNLDKLNKLNTALNAISLPKYNPHVLEVGQLCAARLSVDGKLYRGKVVTVSLELSYEIYFLDYGDAEWVKSQCVYPVSEEFLSLSAQAIPCCLRGFETPDAGEVSFETSAGDKLWDLTRRDTLLIAVEESPSRSDLHEGIPMYSVDLYDSGQLVLDSLLLDIGLESQPADCSQPVNRFRLACQTLTAQEAHSLSALEEVQSSLTAYGGDTFLEVEDWTELGKCIAKYHQSSGVQKLLSDILRIVSSGNQGHRVRICLSQMLHELTQIDLSFESKMVYFQILTVIEKCGTFYKSVLSPDLLHWIVCVFHESTCSKMQSHLIVFMITISQNCERSSGLVLDSGILKDWNLSDIPFVFLELLVSLSGYSALRDRIVDLVNWQFIFNLLSQRSINHNANDCYSLFRLLSLLVRNNQTLKQLLSDKLQFLQKIACIYNDDRINSRFEEIRLFTLSQTSRHRRPSSKYSLFRMPTCVPRPNQTKAPLSPLWSQSKAQIRICCKIENAISADIFASSSSLPALDIFIRTREKLHSASFPLFAAVKKDISRHIYGIEVLFVLTKSQHSVWPQLTTTLAEQKQCRISVDFDRFEMLINSSSEEERSRRTYVRMPDSSSEGSLSGGERIHFSDGGHSDNESPPNS